MNKSASTYSQEIYYFKGSNFYSYFLQFAINAFNGLKVLVIGDLNTIYSFHEGIDRHFKISMCVWQLNECIVVLLLETYKNYKHILSYQLMHIWAKNIISHNSTRSFYDNVYTLGLRNKGNVLDSAQKEFCFLVKS